MRRVVCPIRFTRLNQAEFTTRHFWSAFRSQVTERTPSVSIRHIKALSKGVIGCVVLYDLHTLHWKLYGVWNAPQPVSLKDCAERIVGEIACESVLFSIAQRIGSALGILNSKRIELQNARESAHTSHMQKNQVARKAGRGIKLYTCLQICAHMLCILFFSWVMVNA